MRGEAPSGSPPPHFQFLGVWNEVTLGSGRLGSDSLVNEGGINFDLAFCLFFFFGRDRLYLQSKGNKSMWFRLILRAN